MKSGGLERRDTVMVVDDVPDNLRLLGEILSPHGLRVLQFREAAHALKAAVAAPPDLFLLDVLMPEMDGFELCRRLKTEEPLREIPVLFVSALSDTESILQGFEVGGVDYIPRPLQEQEVLARVLTQLKLRRYQTDLESLVEERTQELRRTQVALLQKEKLASIGRLVAGIAHEINNPSAYVRSNLETLAEYTQAFRRQGELVTQLLEQVAQLDIQALPAPLAQTADALDRHRRREDLHAVEADTTDVIQASVHGMDRITAIVRSLNSFARVDETGERESVNLQGAVENALTVVRTQLKHDYNVVTELEPGLEAWGNPGQLEQVCVNVLLNARDATPKGGEIRITTRADRGEAVIAIADGGPGIPPEIQDKIFDPFFTTKPVGSGTGLGLSVSHQILTGLNGSITARDTDPDGHRPGTEFEIRLPLSP